MKGFFIKTRSIKSRCDRQKIYCLQGCPCSFSLKIFQTGTAKGLNLCIFLDAVRKTLSITAWHGENSFNHCMTWWSWPVVKTPWIWKNDSPISSPIQFNSIQFNSKTLKIPQGAILLWSWRAHKKYIKLREQYNKQKSYFNHSIVINIEQLWLHHKIVMKLRSHTCKTVN